MTLVRWGLVGAWVVSRVLGLGLGSGLGQAPEQSAARLTAESNLVTVRVVVRDGKGQAVAGLKKEDFKLLDRGKEQAITAFEEERGSDFGGAAASMGGRVGESGAAGSDAASEPRLLALFFDDLNVTQADLIHARDAAEQFLSKGVGGKDKVAVFSSDSLLADFTSDPDAIRAALGKANGSSHVPAAVKRCPNLSEYQAQVLLRDYDAKNIPYITEWQVALAESNQCEGKSADALPDGRQIQMIVAQAREVTDEAAARTRGNLEQIERVARYVAKLHGQRTLLLVSAGFLTESEQSRLDRVIDEAVRSQVVISALNPKGLKVSMREADASQDLSSATTKTSAGVFLMDVKQEVASSDVLVEFVRGTGGEYFHNDNDLSSGFTTLAGHPDSYLLSFSPKDLKKDGKFHELKVTLVEKQKGYSVAARRGYFATESDEVASSGEPAPEPAKAAQVMASPATVGGAGSMDDRIKEALLANKDSTDLPIEVQAAVAPGEATLKIHLDARSLPFRKDGERSLDTVTFAAGVFDGDDKIGTIKQRSAKLNVNPEQLQGLMDRGIDLAFTFPLESGMHQLRAVVTESEGHKVGSASKRVEIK